MVYLLYTLYILACIFLIIAVLLQSGKGGDVAAAFGGAGSQTAFGPRGAQKPLEKATIILGATFMLLALLFSLPGVTGPKSVVSDKSVTTEASPSPSPSPSAAPATAPSASPAAAASPAASAAVSPAASPKAATSPAASPSAAPAKK